MAATSIALVFVLVLALCLDTIEVHAFSASGWTKGHATFYGGGDASGTMGMVMWYSQFFFYLFTNLCDLRLNVNE